MTKVKSQITTVQSRPVIEAVDEATEASLEAVPLDLEPGKSAKEKEELHFSPSHCQQISRLKDTFQLCL